MRRCRSAVDPVEATQLAALPTGQWVLPCEVEGGTMTASSHDVFRDLGRFDRLYWLPAGGYGNGLDDEAWAPILDVDDRIAMTLLDILAAAGVPAYAAPMAGVHSTPWAVDRLWVGTSKYGTAESLLMTVLPGLARRLGGEAVR